MHSDIASFFSPGGKGGWACRHIKKSSNFDHFVKENVKFGLVSLKVGGESWGKDILQGAIAPEAPRGYATANAVHIYNKQNLFLLLTLHTKCGGI